MTRARHEHQIALHKTTFGREFSDALFAVINRGGGARWFTVEQIAEIRAEMINYAWFNHKFRREQRKRASDVIAKRKAA